MTQEQVRKLLERYMPDGFTLQSVTPMMREDKPVWRIVATKESKAYKAVLTGKSEVDGYTLDSMLEKGVEALLRTVFVGPFEDAVCARVAEEAGVEVEALMEDLGLR